jgi:hypothetical protein
MEDTINNGSTRHGGETISIIFGVVAQEDKLSTSFSCVTWRGRQNAIALTAH